MALYSFDRDNLFCVSAWSCASHWRMQPNFRANSIRLRRNRRIDMLDQAWNERMTARRSQAWRSSERSNATRATPRSPRSPLHDWTN